MFARRSNRKSRAYYHPPEFSLHQASNSQIGQLPQPPLHSIVNISIPTTTTSNATINIPNVSQQQSLSNDPRFLAILADIKRMPEN